MILSEQEINGFEICKYESTNITQTRYNPETKELIVFFGRAGRVFKYFPVEYDNYLFFKSSESQGKYFISNIQKNPDIQFEPYKPVETND
jgi:hypothetical protein